MIEVGCLQVEDVSMAATLEKECFAAPWSEQSFMDAVSKECYLFLSAKKEDEYIGTAGLILGPAEADVTCVAVKPSYRGKGIALKLMESLIEAAKERKLEKLFLEVREGNAPARRLYEKVGFVEDGIRKNYYTSPVEHAVLMHKELL